MPQAPCNPYVSLRPRPEPRDRAPRRAGTGGVRPGGSRARAARPARSAKGQGGGDPLDLQPDGALRPQPRAAAGRAVARGLPPGAEGCSDAVPLHAAPREGGHACVPRRLGPRLDGPGRAADPGPDEAGGAPRRIRGHARARPQPALPAHVRGRQGRAQPDRHRQRVDLDGGGFRQARRAHLPVDRRAAAPADRRGRDDRPHRDALRRAQAAVGDDREPDDRARPGARRRASGPRRSR